MRSAKIAGILLAVAAAVATACKEPRMPTVAPAKGVAVPHATSIDQSIQTQLFRAPVHTLEGKPASLGDYQGQALLVVNVASKCGFTPQYSGLQKLHETYASRGFAVVGFPCNQFGNQEPGTAAEIRTFCSTRYEVTFPLFEKIAVNGPERHPIYAALTTVPDVEGAAGDVKWNFEKFLVSADGGKVTRFRSKTGPDDPSLVAAIEAALPR